MEATRPLPISAHRANRRRRDTDSGHGDGADGHHREAGCIVAHDAAHVRLCPS
ncbi:MAG: hypothetical protein OXO50_00580 [Caldilineaceae bacterium]|nr:hypothetical protein [Caldilineaceae bacterium]